MAYIYCAEIFCDSCGKDIRTNLDRQGLAPADPLNEWSYDSGEYPKQVDDDEESDCPQHCGSHADCLEAVTLDSGHKVGKPLGELTEDGVEYVREAIAEGGEVAEYWASLYADYL